MAAPLRETSPTNKKTDEDDDDFGTDSSMDYEDQEESKNIDKERRTEHFLSSLIRSEREHALADEELTNKNK
jgi:hypothetical protein